MFKENNNFEKFESKVWLSSPTMHGPEIEYVKEAYETNWMSTVGKNINEVERMACEYIGCKYAVALSAGTASLHLAMKLAGIEAYGMPKVGHGALEGKKVFCSDMTFDATVNPVVYEGGEPVFIDTEYDTWNMDPVALEKAFEIYPDTKVVVVAHLYGTPGKVDELNAVIKKHGAILVEDAAESMGATYKGVQTGMFGKYNTISFNGNKIITGSAGGCFLTDDEEMCIRDRDTEALNIYLGQAASIYEQTVINGLTLNYSTFRSELSKAALAGISAILVSLGICIWFIYALTKMRRKTISYVIRALESSIILTAVPPIIALVMNVGEKLTYSPEYMKSFTESYIHGAILCCLLFSVVLAVFIAALSIISLRINRRKSK